MEDDRLQYLLQRYFDQVLTGIERQELGQLLLASSNARDEFWSLARWNALIRQWGEAEWGRLDAEMPVLRALPSPHKTQTGSVKRWTKQATRALAPAIRPFFAPLKYVRHWAGPIGAAAAAVLFVFGLNHFHLLPQRKAPEIERSTMGIAVLTRSLGAVWEDPESPRAPGEVLHPGWLRLKDGAVQIEFTRGARVILEGPAEFQLVSDNEGELRSGRLRAYVPEPAHGFLVRSKEFSVTDLGTEFGCSVPTSGPAELHVFTGKVSLEMARRPESGRQVPENQAMQIAKDKVLEIPSRPDLFLNDEELARRELVYANNRLSAWRKSSQLISRHPATLIHLDFERGTNWDRTLPNRARRGIIDSDATIVGCDWVSGRWPNKNGLEFKRPDDRLRISVPGLFDSLTLLTWVRVDNLPNSKHSLLMTESFQPGEVNWYLDGDGSLNLGVRVTTGDSSEWITSRSIPIVRPESLGSWVLLTSVYDGLNHSVTHYFNGRIMSMDTLRTDSPLRLDTFEIGNWATRADEPKLTQAAPVDPRDLARNFQGRMDEFALLSIPLEADDIRQIYESGRPIESSQPAVTTLKAPVKKR